MKPDGPRQVQVAFRTSAVRREQIRQRATDAGVTVQVYLESLALGLPFESERPNGRPPGSGQNYEELPLTG